MLPKMEMEMVWTGKSVNVSFIRRSHSEVVGEGSFDLRYFGFKGIHGKGSDYDNTQRFTSSVRVRWGFMISEYMGFDSLLSLIKDCRVAYIR
ncbi:hypothetical protein VNO78_10014 [Psophocarpus tetragonolobus]|uniref:Uncharacterized protein n=1 Tax=Psophocarpus tetragonolobus TaxID=3891 RepID=A0AAN9SLI2_PSOTE